MTNFLLGGVLTVLMRLKYHNYWNLAKEAKRKSGFLEKLRRYYLDSRGCFIGKGTFFASNPILPHGFHGIHISSGAKIGHAVVIFQNVTIGSNTLKDSKNIGAPTIGNNVYIGAGAAIIGKVQIGDNCRIGANCVVVKDMPANTVAVIGDIKFIHKDYPLDNEFIPW